MVDLPSGAFLVSESSNYRRRLNLRKANLLIPESGWGELLIDHRVWRKARQATLTAEEEECASPLARRPYHLRHAAVSTWLNAGVPATQVAEWAGHSVAILPQIYAKCLSGQEELARKRI